MSEFKHPLEFDHPLAVTYRQSGGKGRGPEILVLRRRVMTRLYGVFGAIFAGFFFWAFMDLDCSVFNLKRGYCLLLQSAWPIYLYTVVWLGSVAVLGLLDPRPLLVLDAQGLRFRWAGFIPWSRVKSAEVPKQLVGQLGADYVLQLQFKDKASLFKHIRRKGEAIQKLYFAIQSIPLFGMLVVGGFGKLRLHGTGVHARHLVHWIRQRLDAPKDGAPAEAPSGSP